MRRKNTQATEGNNSHLCELLRRHVGYYQSAVENSYVHVKKKVRIISSLTLSMYGNVLEYIKFNHVNVYFMLYNMYFMQYQSQRHTLIAILRTFVLFGLFTSSRQVI